MNQKMIDAFEKLRDQLALDLTTDDYLRAREMIILTAILCGIGFIVWLLAMYDKVDQTNKTVDMIWSHMQRGYTTQKDVGK